MKTNPPTSLFEWRPIFQTEEKDEDELAEQRVTFYIVFICLMLFFFFGMAIIEKFKPKYGHETCFTVMLGMVVSLLLYAIKGDELTDVWQFSDDMFFNWFLPPIVLNAGFNMYKQKFFENLGNVSIFGICVTFVCFGLYSVLSVLLLKMNPTMQNYYAANHDEVIISDENPQVIDIPVI